MPEASPRSVTGPAAAPVFSLRPSCQVSQSCGSMTLLVRAALAGSCSAIQRSLVTVKDAVGTLPVRLAHSPGPPNSAIRSSACRAERVSFHNSAGRTTRPAASTATMPCC